MNHMKVFEEICLGCLGQDKSQCLASMDARPFDEVAGFKVPRHGDCLLTALTPLSLPGHYFSLSLHTDL